jgi:AcrR family transcriptional regulator
MNADSRAPGATSGAPAPAAAGVPAAKRRLRERFRAETRDAILAAAEAALAQHGARGARMEVIAQQAGIAVGTLYNYFADRQELIDALFEARRRELVEALDDALVQSEAEPFEARLAAFLAAGLGHFQAHRAFVALARHEELRAGVGRWSVLLEMRARAERLIDAGLAAGLLRPEDRATYPHVLLGLLRGLIDAALEADAAPPSAALAAAARCFLQGARRVS